MKRAAWARTIERDGPGPQLRSIKATMLVLSKRMAADGQLARWMDDLLAYTGLPRRTLERHLARAVASGWLVHVVRGGKNRKAVYQAAHPSPPEVADRPVSSTPISRSAQSAKEYGQSRVVSPPSDGGVNKDSASISEHLALDGRIIRRPAALDDPKTKSQKLSEEELAAHSPPLPDSRNAAGPVAVATARRARCFECARPLTHNADLRRGHCAECR